MAIRVVFFMYKQNFGSKPVIDYYPGPQAGFLDRLSNTVLVKSAIALGSLAMLAGTVNRPASAETINKSLKGQSFAQPLERVGYSSNDSWVLDLSVAEQNDQQSVADGATNIRILAPITQGGVEAKNDASRYCNMGRAAVDNGLDVTMTMEGFYRGGKLGYMPITNTERRQYGDYVIDLLQTIHNCVPALDRIEIGWINEPDNPLFNRLMDKGPALVPGALVRLMKYNYQKLHDKATELGIDLTLVMGDLYSGINSDPVKFFEDMAQYAASQKITGRLADEAAIHIYPNLDDPNPNQTVANKIDRVQQALKGFGYSLPLQLNEIGLPTDGSTKSIAAQAQFYSLLIPDAACRGITEINIFYRADNAKDRLTTGVRDEDGQPKPSRKRVKDLFEAAPNGEIPCPVKP
jgi:hypothetical protein